MFFSAFSEFCITTGCLTFITRRFMCMILPAHSDEYCQTSAEFDREVLLSNLFHCQFFSDPCALQAAVVFE